MLSWFVRQQRDYIMHSKTTCIVYVLFGYISNMTSLNCSQRSIYFLCGVKQTTQ